MAWLLGGLSVAQTAPVPAAPQPAPAVKQARPGAGPAAPAQSADGRYGIVILAATVNVHAEPATNSVVIAKLEQGLRLDADKRRGNWYHVSLPEGQGGWIVYVVGKAAPDFAVDAAPGIARARPGGESAGAPVEAPPGAAAPGPLPDDEVVQKIPGAQPLMAPIPTIEPWQVPPPAPLLPRETIPVPDRWRLTDELGLIHQHWYDPYNPNTIKGDRPIFGNDWFFPVTLVSDTQFEWRKLPTSVGAQSTQNAQENDQFGNGRQSTFTENLIASFSLLKGDTTFKPPELEFRLVPVFNYNVSEAQEVGVLNIDPRRGTTRYDHFAAIQEGFVDYEYHIASERYDFDDVRVGIQPFISDFRGFLFQDEPLGIRFFGNRDNNQWQYNVAGFQRLEKDTNSGLNDVGRPPRKDYVLAANLYKQDFFVPGFTLQGTIIYNNNVETATFLNTNGFQVRPAIFGSILPHPYHVTYLGLNGDGHFGPWNTTATLYYANGRDSASQFTGRPADISAFYGVAEVSRDFDWFRIRGTVLYATGDSNPYGNRETGFDAILENPQVAGAETSYWISQAVPLIGGGGVALSGRNGVLADLRSSQDQGQSNFINPGVTLIGVGTDVDVAPGWRVIGNLNELWFNNTTVLSVLRNQGNIDRNIGTDLSAALQFRPLFSQNIVLNASAGVLFPGKALQQLYNVEGAKTQYSILFNILLTY